MNIAGYSVLDGDDLRPQLLGYFICLFTLIINIYGLREGISTQALVSGNFVLPRYYIYTTRYVTVHL
jgi:hypothetical protein